MSKKDNVIIPTAFTDVNHADPGTLPTNRHISDNDGTGGGNMNDKYVTHEELELSNEKILHHIDNKFAEMDKRFAEIDKKIDLNTEKVNTKFANQKVWIILTLISVFASAAGIITFISNILK